MRRALLFVGGALAVLALTAGVLWLVRGPLIEFAATRAMAGAGLEKPSVEFEGLGGSHLSLKDVRAGAGNGSPDLNISAIRIDFSLGDVLTKGRAKTVAVSGGSARALVEEDGAFSLAGWRLDPNARPAPPPFEKLTIDKLAIIAATPKGPAEASLSGAFTMSDGGQFELSFGAARAGFAPAAISRAKGAATIALGEDGAIDVAGGILGDLETASGTARGVDAEFSAALKSWRGVFGDGPRGIFGRASATIKSSTLGADETPSLAAIPAAGAAPVKSLSLKGALTADFSGEGVVARLAQGPIEIATDRGDRLTVGGGDDGVVYLMRGKAGRATLRARLAGPLASGDARLDAATDDGERWAIKAETAFKEQSIAGVRIAGLIARFDGAASAETVIGRLAYDGLIRVADIGRLQIADTPAAGRLDIAVNLEARMLTATPPPDECLRVARATFKLPDQDIDARLAEATFCSSDGAALTATWGGGDRVRLKGALAARNARIKMGLTDYVGAPPAVRFTLDYEPAANTTRATGDFSGGAGVLTKSLKLGNAAGVFEASLAGEVLSATARLSSMTIAQAAALELVAPVIVAGEARLKDDKATFDFDVKTPRGSVLGRGEGRHDVKSGRGEATFDSGDLTFVAGGLQPDRLIPALRGVISTATGAAGGTATFAWTPAGVTSSGSAAAKDVSFQGPGVAVTRTEGVTGALSFTSLMPVATDGEQTVNIRKIDLDALDLENGVMRFSLPGDDTLKIVEAEFPWFGGTIGAYNSTMALSGAKSETKLQIDNVSLSELLAFFKVEGLSGEGVVEGVLPITFEGGRARIDNGILSAKGAGVIRYTGGIAAAAGQANATTELAFDALREFRYEALSTTIDGPLDGTLRFKVYFEGRSDVSMTTSRGKQTVQSPFIFRVNIDAPLLSLLDQAAVSVDVRRQIEQATREGKELKE